MIHYCTEKYGVLNEQHGSNLMASQKPRMADNRPFGLMTKYKKSRAFSPFTLGRCATVSLHPLTLIEPQLYLSKSVDKIG